MNIKKARNFGTILFIRIAASILTIFCLIRVVIPDLVNTHDDFLGFVAVLCMIAVPIIVGWLFLSIFFSINRFMKKEDKE